MECTIFDIMISQTLDFHCLWSLMRKVLKNLWKTDLILTLVLPQFQMMAKALQISNLLSISKRANFYETLIWRLVKRTVNHQQMQMQMHKSRKVRRIWMIRTCQITLNPLHCHIEDPLTLWFMWAGIIVMILRLGLN